MKNLFELNEYRRCDMELRVHGLVGDAGNGVFVVDRDGIALQVIASSGEGWDHLSVSTASRCPTWDEMEHVRKLFTGRAEIWLQFGLPPSQHINVHPFCLHWWRPQRRDVKLPPAYMV